MWKSKNKRKNRKGSYVSRVYRDYEFIRDLGRGSYGVVWSAKLKESSSYEEKFAVKRIFPRDDTEGFDNLRQTENELEALSKLRESQHPNIVEIYTALIEKPPLGWVEDEDALYASFLTSSDGEINVDLLDSCTGPDDSGKICPITIVQEFCSGGSLKTWLQDTPLESREPDLLLNFATQMADGLRFLHHREIIHRDLKPGNIFLRRFKGDQVVLKLGDFGLSKFVVNLSDETGLTADGLGTSLYLSPEQENNQPYGFKVDIYALALIIAALCIPNPAKSVQWQLKDHFKGQLTQPHPALDQIPAPVRSLISEMMSTDPDKRPTACELHSRLNEMWRDNLELPIYRWDKTNSPVISGNVKRFELLELLRLHDEGQENVVFLSGEAGSGKTTLAVQFSQLIETNGIGESVIWIDTNYQFHIKNQLESLGCRVRANIYRSSGHRVAIGEMIQEIHKSFRGKKWVLMLDDLAPSPYADALLLYLLKLVGVKPFVIVCTRRPNFFLNDILQRRQNYVDKDFDEGYKIARMMQNAWRDIPEEINPPEILIKGSENNLILLEFLTESLRVPITRLHVKLGEYLEWNPLALRLATCTICAHDKLPVNTRDALIQDAEEYIALFLQLCEEFRENGPPQFHRYDKQIPTNYTDSFSLKVVLHLTMCQVETALSTKPGLLDTLKELQLYMILYADDRMVPEHLLNDDGQNTAWDVLSIYGLVREWTNDAGNIRHAHICGNHCIDIMAVEGEEFDDELDYGIPQGGFVRYNYPSVE
ncbi:uncharacterized protein LOC110856036 isoform X1 [Folsomia candida]|uniref:uncharacterized protein LOC110856036 isoform X1 n=1 Tax=Folsomia candida TaxID=158441 RepID=UPI0016051C8B|nr:uncharacterized protein LOC110856036 isoform X1 [Folsomia candida]